MFFTTNAQQRAPLSVGRLVSVCRRTSRAASQRSSGRCITPPSRGRGAVVELPAGLVAAARFSSHTAALVFAAAAVAPSALGFPEPPASLEPSTCGVLLPRSPSAAGLGPKVECVRTPSSSSARSRSAVIQFASSPRCSSKPQVSVLRAAVTGGRRGGASARGQGADGVRFEHRQPAPGGAIGGSLQLQRRSHPGTSVRATAIAQYQAAGTAAARQVGRSSRPNPRRDGRRGRLGKDSAAKASPFRVAEARLRAAQPHCVGPFGAIRDATPITRSGPARAGRRITKGTTGAAGQRKPSVLVHRATVIAEAVSPVVAAQGVMGVARAVPPVRPGPRLLHRSPSREVAACLAASPEAEKIRSTEAVPAISSSTASPLLLGASFLHSPAGPRADPLRWQPVGHLSVYVLWVVLDRAGVVGNEEDVRVVEVPRVVVVPGAVHVAIDALGMPHTSSGPSMIRIGPISASAPAEGAAGLASALSRRPLGDKGGRPLGKPAARAPLLGAASSAASQRDFPAPTLHTRFTSPTVIVFMLIGVMWVATVWAVHAVCTETGGVGTETYEVTDTPAPIPAARPLATSPPSMPAFVAATFPWPSRSRAPSAISPVPFAVWGGLTAILASTAPAAAAGPSRGTFSRAGGSGWRRPPAAPIAEPAGAPSGKAAAGAQ